MTTSPDDTPDAERYRVYLLRLWRDTDGPWHASLQAANAISPRRFADLEALIAFLRELVPLPSQAAPTPPPDGNADTDAGGA